MAEMQMASLSRRERNFNQNVGTFSSARQHSEKSRWICLYPCYLNSKKSEVEGRKIPIAKAVENPTINEIKDVLMNANFKIEIEANKSYPRETNKYENRGRIRIQLKNDDGTPINEKFKTSKYAAVL
jgi:signal recognition particle subunit SRP19